ncbi:hypothetical protein MSj_01431 [Microcystis aeruginosa Sj]|jgi:predicted nucleic acid-binding protein|uniref:PIN domain-containing protein n=2 Tax=Microcystis aeruginosa TaxID=1126 RepID=A0A2Z6UK17_MICAE|nr:hypothetical protein [Microcystis aeruginosa]GBL09949.1 hypothetical protein MSj_01431 [Microcystis aeruginosa Sj]GCE60909.1 hypothetical protein MiAbB_02835 [Microcystis aeruginosa NIES-4285]
MIVVSDTSALCNLAIVDHLWLLESIYQTVIIPDVVARELAAASNPIIPAAARENVPQLLKLRCAYLNQAIA